MSESNAVRATATHRDSVLSLRKSRADEISVIEAAYRLGGTELEWLEGIASAASPLLDEGWGIGVATAAVEPNAVRVREVIATGGPEGFAEAAVDSTRNARPEVNLSFVRSAPCTSLNASGVASLVQTDPGSQGLLRLGVRDCMAIVGLDSGRYCTVLSAYRPMAVRPSRRVVSRWSRVASHLAAGFRVRRGLAAAQPAIGPQDAFAGSEAILTTSGRLQHAQRPATYALKALAHAVLAMNRARGSLRTHDPDAALDAWKGLVAGRWSLVEQIDTDGKHFLVARKNDPDTAGPKGLSPRECQVLAQRGRGLALKLIAYELGISTASVSKALQTGLGKLGLACEAELVPLFSRL